MIRDEVEALHRRIDELQPVRVDTGRLARSAMTQAWDLRASGRDTEAVVARARAAATAAYGEPSSWEPIGAGSEDGVDWRAPVDPVDVDAGAPLRPLFTPSGPGGYRDPADELADATALGSRGLAVYRRWLRENAAGWAAEHAADPDLQISAAVWAQLAALPLDAEQ